MTAQAPDQPTRVFARQSPDYLQRLPGGCVLAGLGNDMYF